MTGKTHQLFGVTAALGSYLFLAPSTYAPAAFIGVLVAAHFGSLLPDIDTATSEIWQSLPFGRPVGEVTTTFSGAVTGGHRNLTHSVLGLVLFGWLSFWLFGLAPDYWGLSAHWLWVAFSIGYVSHLLADMLTEAGIPLWWPKQSMIGFPPKPFKDVRIMTDGWFENLVIFPLLNLGLILLIWMYWENIKLILFK